MDDLDEINEVILTDFVITSYGADYPVDGLIKRLDQEDIVIPVFSMDKKSGEPTVKFQRDFVWKKPQADRFVESLLLGLPVPGIFLVKEESGKLLVLDGQQRLRTLKCFYDGIFRGVQYNLENVQKKWIGCGYRTLNPDDRRRLDNAIIHATIVRQDEPTEDKNSIYLIFERLNSGGTILQPQEIRVALYHGDFACELAELNEDENWRALYGRKSLRLKDLELILRFLGLFFYSHSYKRPMKDFLNRYMAANRDLKKQSWDEIAEVFLETCKIIRTALGDRAFRLRNAVNAALLDSVMVGVATRLKEGPIEDIGHLKGCYSELVKNQEFLDAVTKSTADEENVRTRLSKAKEAFGTLR